MINDSNFAHFTREPDARLILDRPSINFDPNIKAAKNDFVSQVDELTKKIQSKSGDDNLMFSDAGLSLLTTGAFESPLTRALREAQALITAGKYPEAIALLNRTLRESPGHPEAIYLLAYCQVNLNELRPALLTLRPLHKVQLEPWLTPKIQALKARIRNNMMLPVLLENLFALRQKKYDTAISKLMPLIQLDPDAEIYHLLFSGTLMLANRLDQALRAVETGIQDCAPAEAVLLQGLKVQIMDRYAAKQLEPARDLVKKGQLARARDKVRSLSTELRRTKLCQQFEKYLDEMERGARLLGSGQRNAALMVVASTYQEMETFHFFLVSNELLEVKQLMKKEKYQDAEKVLARVIAWVPRFPFANFLYAGCTVSRLFQLTSSRKRLQPDELHAMLELAHTHATIGAVDPDIEDAKELVKVIEQALTTERESRLISKLVQEFQAIMAGAKKGIRSVDQLNDAFGRMSRLRQEIRDARSQIQSSNGLQTLKSAERSCGT